MNSSPATWNDFVASQFSNSNNKGVIRAGVLVTAKPSANRRGVYCYAVEFGAYDISKGRTGLEGTTASTTTLPKAGDFSDFSVLATEVDEAITCILALHPRAQVTLLAHSRGGIAARQFLQDPTYTQKASVISLLTTGSPHKGSHLGRIYQWLNNNPRATGSYPSDWQIVDDLISEYSFDVRRPVINDFADNGDAIDNLNLSVGTMKAAIAYGNLRYTTTDMGYLGRKWGISYNVFNGLWLTGIPPLSTAGRNFVLDGGSPSLYKGDGIVEADSQNLLNLAGRPAFTKTYDMAYTKSVYHTEETAPNQVSDMVSGLKYLTGWWK